MLLPGATATVNIQLVDESGADQIDGQLVEIRAVVGEEPHRLFRGPTDQKGILTYSLTAPQIENNFGLNRPVLQFRLSAYQELLNAWQGESFLRSYAAAGNPT